ncbi:MAG: hypothetical protein HY926_04010 [Elusimicrobia bacterium]|nr:hypothetical protein [Elusimicrobiota bacterium]
MTTILLVLSLAACAAEPAVPAAVEISTPAAAKRLEPPVPPAHAKRLLQTATDVAGDLAETVAYLEAGQVYFRAFARETHSNEENQAMLRFLREYEAELDTAKKEEKILNDWIRKAASLK